MTVVEPTASPESLTGAAVRQASRAPFRADINGLRAVSVLAVIVFHFAPRLAPGGFAGVDVFFVISGFLITRIVAARLERGRFAYGPFMGERARRIVPALACMCAVVLLLGSTVLDPWAFERLAGSIPPALFFVSNIIYALRTGYFSPAAANDWMTHTWSLSVEGQFYLAYPIVVAALGRAAGFRRHPAACLAGLGVLVFALGVAAPERWRSWEFYLASSRSWEFFAGGACAFAAPGLRLTHLQRQGLHAGGLALIGAGFALLAPDTSWPAPASALPVVGAALVLLAGVEAPAWASLAPVRRIGLSSYSAYLWHWPLAVALRYWGVAFTPTVVALGVAASLLIGLASYELVEQQATRVLMRLPGYRRAAVGAAATLLVAMTGWTAVKAHGFERQRTLGLPVDVQRSLADDRAAARDWTYPTDCDRIVRIQGLSLCQLGDPHAYGALVIGDSRAEEFAARYAGDYAGTVDGVSLLTREGCPPLPGVGLNGSMSCPHWSAAAFQYAARSAYARIVIVAAWPTYIGPDDNDLAATPCFAKAGRCALATGAGDRKQAVDAAFVRLAQVVRSLRAGGKTVVIVGPSPRSEAADPRRLYAAEFWSGAPKPQPIPRGEVEADAASSREALREIARSTGASFVDPISALCAAGPCPTAEGNLALYMNPGHFRASQMRGARFSYLDAWLGPPSTTAGRPLRGAGGEKR